MIDQVITGILILAAVVSFIGSVASLVALVDTLFRDWPSK